VSCVWGCPGVESGAGQRLGQRHGARIHLGAVKGVVQQTVRETGQQSRPHGHIECAIFGGNEHQYSILQSRVAHAPAKKADAVSVGG